MRLYPEDIDVMFNKTPVGTPVIPEVNDSDWVILAADFDSEVTAQQLAAMLNHQGPTIPTRKVEKGGFPSEIGFKPSPSRFKTISSYADGFAKTLSAQGAYIALFSCFQ